MKYPVSVTFNGIAFSDLWFSWDKPRFNEEAQGDTSDSNMRAAIAQDAAQFISDFSLDDQVDPDTLMEMFWERL